MHIHRHMRYVNRLCLALPSLSVLPICIHIHLSIGSEWVCACASPVAYVFSLSYLSLSGGRIHIYMHIRYVRSWCLAPPTLSVLPIHIYSYR